MSAYALLFEAESIQAYIHDSGHLREAVGSSQLVVDLYGGPGDKSGGDLLSRVLTAAQVEPGDASCSRRGGTAFIAFFKGAGQRDRFRVLCSLAIAEQAPGLLRSDAVADEADEADEYNATKADMATPRDFFMAQTCPNPTPCAAHRAHWQTGRRLHSSWSSAGKRSLIADHVWVEDHAVGVDMNNSIVRLTGGLRVTTRSLGTCRPRPTPLRVAPTDGRSPTRSHLRQRSPCAHTAGQACHVPCWRLACAESPHHSNRFRPPC